MAAWITNVLIASTFFPSFFVVSNCWKSCNALGSLEVWKSMLSRSIKERLFQAAIESILLCLAETLTLTNKIQKSLNGCYTRMLRSAFKISWRDKMTNLGLYDEQPRLWQKKIRDQRLKSRQGETVSKIVLQKPQHGHKKPGRSSTTYVDVLIWDTCLITEELETTMKDRSVRRAIIQVRLRSTQWVSVR